MSAPHGRNVSRQLAILNVAARAEGLGAEEIREILQQELARRSVPEGPGPWMESVVAAAALGHPYVIGAAALQAAETELRTPAGRELHITTHAGTEALSDTPPVQGSHPADPARAWSRSAIRGLTTALRRARNRWGQTTTSRASDRTIRGPWTSMKKKAGTFQSSDRRRNPEGKSQ